MKHLLEAHYGRLLKALEKYKDDEYLVPYSVMTNFFERKSNLLKNAVVFFSEEYDGELLWKNAYKETKKPIGGGRFIMEFAPYKNFIFIADCDRKHHHFQKKRAAFAYHFVNLDDYSCFTMNAFAKGHVLPSCVFAYEENIFGANFVGQYFYKQDLDETINGKPANKMLANLFPNICDRISNISSQAKTNNIRPVTAGNRDVAAPVVGDEHKFYRITNAPTMQVETGMTRDYQPRRNHGVRGHWRTFPNGKKTWVRSHRRGDENLGTISKDYFIEAAE